MQLTAQEVMEAPSFMNAIYEHTLSLRSKALTSLDDIHEAQDVYECLDLSDNRLSSLEGFLRKMFKTKTILASQNEIGLIQPDLALIFPNLERLLLVQNRIDLFKAVKTLGGLKLLRNLSLLNNPITQRKDYRLAVIRLVPLLEVLDFHRVKDKERQLAKEVETSTLFAEDQKQIETAVESSSDQAVIRKLSEEDRKKLKEELINAKSLEQIKEIEQRLKSGYW